MITIDSLDLRDREVKRNMKSAKELKIEKVTLFGEFDPSLVRVRKNLPNDFKQEFIKLLRKITNALLRLWLICCEWTKAKNLDFLEEDREMACIQLVTYKERVKKYF